LRAARTTLTAALITTLWACADSLILVPDPVQVRVGPIPREDLEGSLAGVTRRTDERAELLAASFHAVGCPAEALRVIPGTRGENVICTLSGATPWTIVVGANVDRPSEGSGIVDNGTGMALLPLLYAALRIEPRRHTFVFAGFTDAILKQRGARRYLRDIGSEGREHLRAMVQLKALGLGPTAMWGHQADDELRQDLFSVSRALDLPLRDVGFHKNVALDAKAFRRAGVPVITVHSLDRGTARLLTEPHLDRDIDAIDWDSYAESARLLAFYLAYLDTTLQVRIDSQPESAAPQEPAEPL
jgi:hypothetical protein